MKIIGLLKVKDTVNEKKPMFKKNKQKQLHIDTINFKIL